MKEQLYKPKPTTYGNKKYEVLVKSDKGNVKKIYFGDKRYEDYTQHRDKDRRANFRARHNCDPVSKLDKNKPKYWACQYLWGNR